MTLDDKHKFIDEVVEASHMWDAVAASSSVEAVRSGKKEDLDSAKAYVARAHACKEFSEKVIAMIHRYCRVSPEPEPRKGT